MWWAVADQFVREHWRCEVFSFDIGENAETPGLTAELLRDVVWVRLRIGREHSPGLIVNNAEPYGHLASDHVRFIGQCMEFLGFVGEAIDAGLVANSDLDCLAPFGVTVRVGVPDLPERPSPNRFGDYVAANLERFMFGCWECEVIGAHLGAVREVTVLPLTNLRVGADRVKNHADPAIRIVGKAQLGDHVNRMIRHRLWCDI